MDTKRYTALDVISIRLRDFLYMKFPETLESWVEVNDNYMFFKIKTYNPIHSMDIESIQDFIKSIGINIPAFSITPCDNSMVIIFAAPIEHYLEKLNKENENESVNKQC